MPRQQRQGAEAEQAKQCLPFERLDFVSLVTPQMANGLVCLGGSEQAIRGMWSFGAASDRDSHFALLDSSRWGGPHIYRTSNLTKLSSF